MAGSVGWGATKSQRSWGVSAGRPWTILSMWVAWVRLCQDALGQDVWSGLGMGGGGGRLFSDQGYLFARSWAEFHMASVFSELNNFLVLTLAPSAVCQAEKASQALKNDSPLSVLRVLQKADYSPAAFAVNTTWMVGWSWPFFLERIPVVCWSTGPSSWLQADWSVVTTDPGWGI